MKNFSEDIDGFENQFGETSLLSAGTALMRKPAVKPQDGVKFREAQGRFVEALTAMGVHRDGAVEVLTVFEYGLHRLGCRMHKSKLPELKQWVSRVLNAYTYKYRHMLKDRKCLVRELDVHIMLHHEIKIRRKIRRMTEASKDIRLKEHP